MVFGLVKFGFLFTFWFSRSDSARYRNQAQPANEITEIHPTRKQFLSGFVFLSSGRLVASCELAPGMSD